MPSLIFDTCCGCIELKTGCLIIGYLELVAEIIISLVILGLMATGGMAAASDTKDAQNAGIALLAFGIVLTLVLVLLLAFTITLLVGLHKSKRGHVKAYLIYSAIFLVIGVVMFFASFSQHVKIGTIFSNLFGLLIHLYFLLVIRSHYYKMDDANKGAIYNTA